jgi:hypothetical protein
MRLAAWLMIPAIGSLAACGYHPSVMHPTLADPTAADITLTCEQIDLAVDRADTVRWVIRDDGGELETDNARATRYSANVLVVPLSILAMFPTAVPDGGGSVLDAADRRLLALLELKRDRRCLARPTTFPGKDELAVAADLEALQARIGGEEGRSESLLAERTRLLDGLRVLPPSD